MNRQIAYKLALLSGAAVALQGCVAVVPIAAGGLMGGSTVARSSSSESTETQPEVDPSVTVGLSEPEQAGSPQAENSEAQVPDLAGTSTRQAQPESEEEPTRAPEAQVENPVADSIEGDAIEPVTDQASTAESVPVQNERLIEQASAQEQAEAAAPSQPAIETDAVVEAPLLASLDGEEASSEPPEPQVDLDDPEQDETVIENGESNVGETAGDLPQAAPAAAPVIVDVYVPQTDPAPAGVGETSVAELASDVDAPPATSSDPTPAVEQAGAEPHAEDETGVRVIDVDSRLALLDDSASTPNVSAAQAAAALASASAEEDETIGASDLARSQQPVVSAPAVDLADDNTPEGESATALAEGSEAAEALATQAMLDEVAEVEEVPAAEADPIENTADEPAMAEASASEPAIPLPVEERAATVAEMTPETAPMPQPALQATGPFAVLINYANAQSLAAPEDRLSAMLANRALLQPERAVCGGIEPTLLIDLDPEGDMFDPTNNLRASQGLASALAQLRAAGVKIAWISANPLRETGRIRGALNRSGLDIGDTDQLLLMRYPEDRKQTRREDLAAESCLIAIAGDTRTDFDDLYEYLLYPNAAATLEPLFDNGWFLIPNPLVSERPTP